MDSQHFGRNSSSIGAQAEGNGKAKVKEKKSEKEPYESSEEEPFFRIVHPSELMRCRCPEKHRSIQIIDEELPRCFECCKPQEDRQKGEDKEKTKYEQGEQGGLRNGADSSGTGLELRSTEEYRTTASTSQEATRI